MAETPAPSEVRVSPDRRQLTLVWPEAQVRLAAETLRVNSPSAEVKGHFGRGGVTPTGKADVTLHALEPVGSYALKIVFSDGHRTGLYTWAYLRGLQEDGDA